MLASRDSRYPIFIIKLTCNRSRKGFDAVSRHGVNGKNITPRLAPLLGSKL
jgi:hypothetical protein